MLRIRLTRVGKKNAAFFRIVLAEKLSPIKGKFIEILGYYNPRSKEFKIKEDRLKYWIEQGAKPSPTLHNLLVKKEIIPGPKVKATTIKKKSKKEEPAKEEKAPEKKPEPAEKKEEPKSEKS